MHSDFNLDPNATTSLTVSRSRFEKMATDYYGVWLYSSLSDVKVRAMHDIDSPCARTRATAPPRHAAGE